MNRKELIASLNGTNIDDLSMVYDPDLEENQIYFGGELVVLTQKEKGYFLNDVRKYLKLKNLAEKYRLSSFKDATYDQIRFGMYIYTRLYNIPYDPKDDHYIYRSHSDQILFGLNWNGYSKPNNVIDIKNRLKDVDLNALSIQSFSPTFWQR